MWRSSILIGLLLLGGACNCNSSPAFKGSAAAAHPSAVQTPAAQDPALPSAPPADPREPRIGKAVTQLLEHDHLRPHVIDDGIAQKAFGLYIDRLDPGKMVLLKPQVAVLERDATRMDDQLHEGDFKLGRVGAALLAQERKKVAASVAELLRAPFDFSKDESFETDPKKLERPATEQERVDRWRKTLKQQVLERIERMEETAKLLANPDKKSQKPEDEDDDPRAAMTPPPPTFEGREAKAREDLARSYAGRFQRLQSTDPLAAAEQFVNAFAAAFDPHTLYLAPEQQEDFDIQISGSLEGIGAVLTEQEHYIEVRELVAGGAAWREGELEAGDLIMAVKQKDKEPVDVADMRINEVVRMIRGPKGSVVTLTVKKPDERVVSISITRDLVVVEDAYARGALLQGPKLPTYGYVYLPSFYGNTRASKGGTPEREATGDVRALLQLFSQKKVSGVVLDLRGNGGGLLNHANDITGLFVDKGPVVAAKDAEGKLQVLGDSDAGEAFAGDVVVLVDRFSASAAEILAGALQDYERAVVVGTETHGKGTVQAMVDLDRVEGFRLRMKQAEPLGVMKLTIQQFFLVDGESTQWQGVKPDVALPDQASYVDSGERFLDNAIPWSHIDPLPATHWSHPQWNVAALRDKSAARQAQEPTFAKVTARGDYLRARREDTVVPLQRDAWQQKRAKEKQELEQLDPKVDEGPERFQVAMVEYRPAQPSADTAKRAGGATRVDRWKQTLAHDPWVAESLQVLADMGVRNALTSKSK